jgi:hypothetical protein
MNTNDHAGKTSSLEVGLISYQVIGLVVVVVGGGAFLGAFLDHQYGVSVLFVVFAVLGIYIILVVGRYTLDEVGITNRNFFGTYRMLWGEIRKIEIGRSGVDTTYSAGALLLSGDNKQFFVAQPSAWSGPQKTEALALLSKKIAESGVTPVETAWAGFKSHRNVKVSWPQV